jgi:hypothetical protein
MYCFLLFFQFSIVYVLLFFSFFIIVYSNSNCLCLKIWYLFLNVLVHVPPICLYYCLIHYFCSNCCQFNNGEVVELMFNGTFGNDYCKLFLNNLILYVIRLE